MAGVKGRSGGARPNSGPKKRPPAEVSAEMTPLEFLKAVMSGAIQPTLAQLDAAKAAARYEHQVAGGAGKKERAAKTAEDVAGGKFGTRPAPGLRRVA